MRANRAPKVLRDAKKWQKTAARGQMRYAREGDTVCVQWMDKKPVTVATTECNATSFDHCHRNSKDAQGHHVALQVKRPACVAAYNEYMGGVDIGDQHLASFELHRPSRRYWKAMFLHLLNLAVTQGYHLFSEYRNANPGAIKRVSTYGTNDFRLAVARQFADIAPDAAVPVALATRQRASSASSEVFNHMPGYDTYSNCRVCKKMSDKVQKTNVICSTCKQPNGHPVRLCFQPDRNCFQRYHSPECADLRNLP